MREATERISAGTNAVPPAATKGARISGLPATGGPDEAFLLPADWKAFHEANPDVEAVDVFIMDVNGQAVGKRLRVEDAARIFEAGVQYSACAPMLDCRGLGQNPGGLGGDDGDPDGTAWPVAGGLSRVPWASAPTAQLFCAMRDVEARAPLWFDPRTILHQVVARCHEAGLRPVVACELEFYLVHRERGPDGRLRPAGPRGGDARRAANLSMEAVEEASELLRAIALAADVQRVPASSAVAEYGLGQYEINLRHGGDPVRAADQAVLLKRIIRGVARARGLDATFMAKPFMDQAGSGMHVHVSLDDGQGGNRFGQDGGETLLESAIAGLQATMYDAVALFAPNFNSYRRYRGPFTPSSLDWSHNNRSVAVRIPVEKGSGRRLEHRVAGADASPHLVLAAILAGVHLGVTEGRRPTTPVSGRHESAPWTGFPHGLLLALDRLQRSELLGRYIRPDFLRAYAQLKQGEHDELFGEVLAAEHDFYQ
jgi:glutamine synthetase